MRNDGGDGRNFTGAVEEKGEEYVKRALLWSEG